MKPLKPFILTVKKLRAGDDAISADFIALMGEDEADALRLFLKDKNCEINLEEAKFHQLIEEVSSIFGDSRSITKVVICERAYLKYQDKSMSPVKTIF